NKSRSLTWPLKSWWVPGAAAPAPPPGLVFVVLAQAARARPPAKAAASFTPRHPMIATVICDSLLTPDRTLGAGLAAGSLNEGSVNLDGLFQRPVESAKAPESFHNG